MPFWPSSSFLFFSFFLGGGALHKNVLCKVSPFIVKASPTIAYHKIQWLQCANRNIDGLQYWHSSIHFRIPITSAILTLQLRLGTDYNFGLASIAICEHGFPKKSWVKSDCGSRLKLETLDALMRVSDGKLWIGLEFPTLGNRP
jgi:hypothetical protein